ncbi:MAG: radical SAM family heme chaperone HemW [Planctomycetaceae bacterium]|nr:radical SAM family heme chaperone HemW [Planctomycetaceae bacterium]
MTPAPPPTVTPRAAYVHVPFCRHRCGYCNFTLIAGRDDLIPSYLQALEIELSALDLPQQVDTLFVGGGTPSHLDPTELEHLLKLVTTWFPLSDQAEFTLEANPCDVEHDRIEVMSSAGVNRISLGVQSFNDDKLQVLERDHRLLDIHRAVDVVRQKIDNLCLDLIFGVPGESRDVWRRDLQAAILLEPQHLSTYGLTFEKGTPFWSRREKQQLNSISESDEAWMYEFGMDTLNGAGFEHYEISNFSKPGFRSLHNQTYWTGDPYFAAGPGAARFQDGRRETNYRSTTTYLNRVLAGQSHVAESEQLSDEQLAREQLVFGLRRIQGVDRVSFRQRTGFEIEQLVGDVLPKYLQQGWLVWQAGSLCLTRTGLLFSDSIWPDFF